MCNTDLHNGECSDCIALVTATKAQQLGLFLLHFKPTTLSYGSRSGFGVVQVLNITKTEKQAHQTGLNRVLAQMFCEDHKKLFEIMENL